MKLQLLFAALLFSTPLVIGPKVELVSGEESGSEGSPSSSGEQILYDSSSSSHPKEEEPDEDHQYYVHSYSESSSYKSTPKDGIHGKYAIKEHLDDRFNKKGFDREEEGDIKPDAFGKPYAERRKLQVKDLQGRLLGEKEVGALTFDVHEQ